MLITTRVQPHGSIQRQTRSKSIKTGNRIDYKTKTNSIVTTKHVIYSNRQILAAVQVVATLTL